MTTRGLLGLGAVITAVLALAPLVDINTVDTIGDHVRAAYPQWDDATIAADRGAIAGYLTGAGVLGVGGWLVTLWTTRRPGRGRWVAVTMLAMGTIVVLANLSLGGENYERIVPMPYAAAWVVPVLVGAVACARVWRSRTDAAPALR